MEILLILGIIGGAYSIARLATMPKKERNNLFKIIADISKPFVLLLALFLIGMATLCTWLLIDEKSAVTFIFHGAVTEPMFVGNLAWMKWWICLPLPFAIPWIIYRIILICKGTN